MAFALVIVGAALVAVGYLLYLDRGPAVYDEPAPGLSDSDDG